MNRERVLFLVTSVSLMLCLVAGAVFGKDEGKRDDLFRHLSIFTEVFSIVRSNYVEEVKPDQLVDGAFSGVTDAIDEFSYYIPPPQVGKYRKTVGSPDEVLGLVVSKRFGYAYVVATLDGSGAAGQIEPGDFIEKINGQLTQKMQIWQIREGLRAVDGKAVSLSVLRGGLSKRDEVKLAPAPYPVAVPTLKQVGRVAIVRIPSFSPGTGERFADLLAKVESSGTKRLIVDLRNNASGIPDEAIAAVDQLLTRGTVTSLVGRRVEAKKWTADAKTAFSGEVEVLIDHSTAGGAEVFAAAVHGNGRGKVIGISSYGKTVVQKFVELPTKGALYVTIGHYTTPDLKPIKEQGVRPDVIVDMTAHAIRKSKAGTGGAPKDDPILEKALSLFGEKLPLATAA